MTNEQKTHCDACHCSGVVVKNGIRRPQRMSDLITCDICLGDVDRDSCDVCEIEKEMAEEEERMENERS